MTATHAREIASGYARVELVDNWHKHWPEVLRAVGRYCDRASLHVDEDGWLSARQNLLVAFVEDEPAAHLCFHVEPAHREGKPATRGCVEAKLDSYGINPRFCGQGIERELRNAALARAGTMQCSKLHGFDLKETWC